MEKIFLGILNMGYMASWAIVFVLLGRLVLKRAPKKYAYLLWAIPFIRLMIPISIESVVSIMPQVSYSTATNSAPQIQTGITILNQSINPYLFRQVENDVTASINRLQIWTLIAEIIWITGMVALLLCSGYSMLHLRKKLVGAVRIKDNLWMADHVTSPFVVGVVHPRIYLPSCVDEQELDYMIHHEQIHIRRRDYLVKIVIYAALIIYWFHPLVWLAYFLCVKDMEMSCDEAVLRESNADIRSRYADSLLKLTTGRYPLLGAPIAFGESNTKSRIKHVLHYKEPAFWAGLAAIIVLIVLAVCLLSNPKKSDGRGSLSTEATEQRGTEEVLDTQQNIEMPDEEETELAGMNDIDGMVVAPELDPNMDMGADGVYLDYADERYVIFHGFFGLFVYDMERFEIVGAVDLEPIGCNYTQGDNYCEVSVAADGTKVYLHPASEDTMYVYDVNMNQVEEQVYDMEGIELFDKLVSNDAFVDDWIGVRSEYRVRYDTDSGNYYGFLESSDGTIGQLQYVLDDMVYDIWGNSITYNMKMDEPQSIVPFIRLNTASRRYTFVSSLLSSVLITGTYEVEGDILTATTDGGTHQYLFEVVDDTTLRFIEEGSSEVIQYEEEIPKIVDKTEFVAQ